MTKYFFPPTREAIEQITELFDFTWPTAAALWNLRWQVEGFLKEVPHASTEQLNQRFVFGSKIHGVNLKKSCIDITWEEQKSILSAFILTNSFAIYESWADEILNVLDIKDLDGKSFQNLKDKNKKEPGLFTALSKILSSQSDVLRISYFPVFSSGKKYSYSALTNLLICYRYFKEARNSLIHSGGIASDCAQAAYDEFAPISDKQHLSMKANLEHSPLVKGQRVVLHLRGVVGFCDVLIRLMSTIDAELCKSMHSERIFERILRDVNKNQTTLSSNVEARHRQVLKHCLAAGLPRPAKIDPIYQFMRTKKIISV